MALVTVQRSPSVSSSPQSSDSGAGVPVCDDDAAKTCKSLSECYFAGKGAALVLPPNKRARPSRRVSTAGCDIQQHLQSMFYLLRPEETLKMAVKLESVHPGRTRYLVVVSCTGRQDAEESCLLGIDCHSRATVGLVLRVLADTSITLDGDGGFSVSVSGRQHIFKPVSVQAMWSALQTLHKVSSKARGQNYFHGGLSHDWVSYYEHRIESDRSCLNEWHAMDNLESRRPPSPDSIRNKPRERKETERVIRTTLKEIMMSVDLDEVTSKYIRGGLEEDLDMDLGEFKPFIDQEMLIILGQIDAPTEIFGHVYLGSEWNASNLEELQKNGVRHILNVTREIDNFFPGMFNYLNVRVYDDDKTDLLKHWDDTFKYITKVKKEGSKVLVHCKMGVSRSASVVIAYAMKAYNWDFSQAWKHVKDKRNCIKPNSNFILQLETYQGILDAMKNKEKLQRSKSDTNLKSPAKVDAKENNQICDKEVDQEADEENMKNTNIRLLDVSGTKLRKTGQRPKSWSPNVEMIDYHVPGAPFSHSLGSIDKMSNTKVTRVEVLHVVNAKRTGVEQEARNVLMPCGNGQSYSVSQNQIVHLPGPDSPDVKHHVIRLETFGQRKRGLVLNLTNRLEAVGSDVSSPESDIDTASTRPILSPKNERLIEKDVLNNVRERRHDKGHMKNDHTDYLVWNASSDAKYTVSHSDIGANNVDLGSSVGTTAITSIIITSRSMSSSSASNFAGPAPFRRKGKRDGDPFSVQLDRVFDREEKRGDLLVHQSPSRQSSWSSYDSAIMLDNNSVHSSWATLSSRNSSWGSYDMTPNDSLGSRGLFTHDKEEIPGYPGTVKRTKQKLQDGKSTGIVKRVSAQSNDAEGRSISKMANVIHDDVQVGYNPFLFHCMQSPASRRRNTLLCVNDNATCRESNDISTVEGCRPIDCIDIEPVVATRQLERLSTSAPTPSSITSDSDILMSRLRTCRSESKTSNPRVVNKMLRTSLQQNKTILEMANTKMCSSKSCLSTNDSPPKLISSVSSSSSSLSSSSSNDWPRNILGIVKNLKKEFEAKSTKFETGLETNNCQQTESGQWPNRKSKIIRSLPSSPVITHCQTKIRSMPCTYFTDRDGLWSCKSNSKEEMTKAQKSIEDMSVRVLVGKYEVAKPENLPNSEIQLRMHKERDSSLTTTTMEAYPPARSKIATREFARRSAPIVISHPGQPIVMSPEVQGRSSVSSPSVGVSSVVVKAASKKQQQHGKIHPLARLQVRPRHGNPVYNTM